MLQCQLALLSVFWAKKLLHGYENVISPLALHNGGSATCMMTKSHFCLVAVPGGSDGSRGVTVPPSTLTSHCNSTLKVCVNSLHEWHSEKYIHVCSQVQFNTEEVLSSNSYIEYSSLLPVFGAVDILFWGELKRDVIPCST